MTSPILTDSYEGYQIAVWPAIHFPPFKDFYADATIDRAGKIFGFGGIGGDTPEAAMQNAKRVIDDQDFGSGGSVEKTAKERATSTAQKFGAVKPYSGMGEGMP